MNLEKRLRYWQGVLRLNDWEIQIEEVGMAKLDNPGNHIGELHPDLFHKKAKILILAKADNPTKIEQEHTLVHELIHIHLLELNGEMVPKEQAINSLASALMGLERE